MKKLTTLTALAGALTMAVAAPVSADMKKSAENPMCMEKDMSKCVKKGKAMEGKCGEGKCGEGKCGGHDHKAKAMEGKCGEGKCGGHDHKHDNKGKAMEGKCGEGKCGSK